MMPRMQIASMNTRHAAAALADAGAPGGGAGRNISCGALHSGKKGPTSTVTKNIPAFTAAYKQELADTAAAAAAAAVAAAAAQR